MGVKEDIEDSIKDKSVTKVHGQPTDKSLSILCRELNQIAASIPTSLGGGTKGHLGLLLSNEQYRAISNNVDFVRPNHPGIYPADVGRGAEERARAEVQHRASIREFETYLGVENALKMKIQEAVDADWLAEIEDEHLGFLQVTARQMIEHLADRGGELDFVDTTALEKERDEPWNPTEHVTTYFNRVERCKRSLAKAGITTCMNSMRNKALDAFKKSGEFKLALKDWDNKPDADKTWANLKPFFTKEYAKINRDGELTAKDAGFAGANNAQEIEAAYAVATADIIKQLTDSQAKQMTAMMEKQNEMLATLIKAFSSSSQKQLGKDKDNKWTTKRSKSVRIVKRMLIAVATKCAGSWTKTKKRGLRTGNLAKPLDGTRGKHQWMGKIVGNRAMIRWIKLL